MDWWKAKLCKLWFIYSFFQSKCRIPPHLFQIWMSNHVLRGSLSRHFTSAIVHLLDSKPCLLYIINKVYLRSVVHKKKKNPYWGVCTYRELSSRGDASCQRWKQPHTPIIGFHCTCWQIFSIFLSYCPYCYLVTKDQLLKVLFVSMSLLHQGSCTHRKSNPFHLSSTLCKPEFSFFRSHGVFFLFFLGFIIVTSP